MGRRRGSRRRVARQGVSLVAIAAWVVLVAAIAAAIVYVYLRVRTGTM
jgi:hypothetical protein